MYQAARLLQHILREIQGHNGGEAPAFRKPPCEEARPAAQVYDSLPKLWLQVLQSVLKLLVCKYQSPLRRLYRVNLLGSRV